MAPLVCVRVCACVHVHVHVCMCECERIWLMALLVCMLCVGVYLFVCVGVCFITKLINVQIRVFYMEMCVFVRECVSVCVCVCIYERE